MKLAMANAFIASLSVAQEKGYDLTDTNTCSTILGFVFEQGWQAAPEIEQELIKVSWFSVDDKLPNNFVPVLVLDSQEGYRVAMYSAEYNQWFSADNYHLYDVTHWMLIPEYTEI
jgi:hypothetical protein